MNISLFLNQIQTPVFVALSPLVLYAGYGSITVTQFFISVKFFRLQIALLYH